jgi:hypothetical protein
MALAGEAVERCKASLDRRWLRAHTPQIMPPQHEQSAPSTPELQHQARGTLLPGNVPTR